MLRRLALLATLAVAAIIALASPAWAHVELEPAEAVAGSTATLTFHVAYEGAGTTGLEVQLPEGASAVELPAQEGWTAATDPDAGTVTWTGGPVEEDVELRAVVQLPETIGEVLFPAIQLTTEGEVAWIGEEAGESHDSNPAPRITLTADPNGTSTTTEATTTTSEAPSTTTTADLPGTTLEAADDGDDDEAAPWLIGGGIAAIVVIGVGGWLLKRRSDADRASQTAGPADPAGDGTT